MLIKLLKRYDGWLINLRLSWTIKEAAMFSDYVESTMGTIMIFIHTLVCHEWKAHTERTNAAENNARPKVGRISSLIVDDCGDVVGAAWATDQNWLRIIRSSNLIYGLHSLLGTNHLGMNYWPRHWHHRLIHLYSTHVLIGVVSLALLVHHVRVWVRLLEIRIWDCSWWQIYWHSDCNFLLSFFLIEIFVVLVLHKNIIIWFKEYKVCNT